LVTENYLYRGRDDVELNIYEKSVVQPRRTLSCVTSPHRFLHYSRGNLWKLEDPVDETGHPATRGFHTAGLLRVNHYRSKSVAEAMAKAQRRKSGSVDSGQLESLVAHSLNELRDEDILRFVPQLRKELAAVNRLPRIPENQAS
jgi:hypothetical protein